MRTFIAVVVALALAACTAPVSASGPSAAIVDMRNRFEAAVLAMEDQYKDSPEALRQAALPIALNIYGANWSVVRAEAERSLSALPEIDLSPYASATASPHPFEDLGEALREIAPMMTPAGLAMMRFWDAQSVGGMIAPMVVRLDLDNDSAAMIGTKLSLVPMRVARGKFDGRDVIAARYMRSMVMIPYSLTDEGLIMPAFDLLKVYPLAKP